MSTNQSVLIAGGSRGLGLLMAREFLGLGYAVHICARDAEELERAAVDLRRRGGTVTARVVDVRDAHAVEAWVAATYPDGTAPDVALHVAGIIQVGPWDAVEPAMTDECVDTMTKGAAYLAWAIVPRMRAAGRGRIGIMSSIGGVISVPHLIPYSMAKFGAAGLAYGLQAELSGTGVTCTAICPPPMRTGSHLHAQFSGRPEAEYAWFAPAASLPLASLDGTTAARRIVRAVLAGRSVVGPTPLPWLARRVFGLALGLTIGALGLAGRLLPRGKQPPRAGLDVRDRASRTVRGLTRLGDRKARHTNENHRSVGDPDL
ncbi:SDR family oxidoreductase [Ammonicoccus fulvus]|uniref:SDR family oxidoreductase n=1 Tax=Ammonicoccus fulvus TaxID=3138240 RepID=A0ABZ3FNT0_9ACTN